MKRQKKNINTKIKKNNVKELTTKFKKFIQNKRNIMMTIGLTVIVVVICIVFVTGLIKRDNPTKTSMTSTESKSEIVESTNDSNSTKIQDTDTIEETTAAESKENTEETCEEQLKQAQKQESESANEVQTGNYYGALKVCGNQLTDINGTPVQLKGLSTHGIAWYPDYLNNECFKELHEYFGINLIRLAMYTSEYNGYCNGGDKSYLKDLIDKGVQYATDNDMYVIIDWHILSDNNPNLHLSESIDFFTEMASKYASNDHVIYEICNEPNGGTSWQEIKSYATKVIGKIREYNDDAIIIVGTPNWSQYVNQAAEDPINEYDNIMYSLHFYAATHKKELRNTMVSAMNDGLPVFVTEFGICDASGNGAIDEEEASQWINLMNSKNISYAMWNISNKQETSAIFNSQCQKVSNFSSDDLSAAGKWFLRMMTGQIDLSENCTEEMTSNLDNEIQQPQELLQSDYTNKSTNLNVTARAINSWVSNGKTFYQYEITATNNSGTDCEGWSIDLNFNENVELSDNWNGTFTVNNTTIHIESVDYNAIIKNGESITNIGMIVAGSDNLEIK